MVMETKEVILWLKEVILVKEVILLYVNYHSYLLQLYHFCYSISILTSLPLYHCLKQFIASL